MAGAFDKFKQFIGFGDLDDDGYEYETDSVSSYDNYEIEDEVTPYDDLRLEKAEDKVIDLNSSRTVQKKTAVKVIIHEPSAYDEVTKMIDELRADRIIVINMLGLEHELKSNVFHCLSGAVYAVDGSMQKVAKDIFVIAPNNVEVDSKKLSEEISSRGIFSWQR